MLKYQNTTEWLSSHFEMISTVNDYIKTKRFIFRCKEFSHSNELSTASFSNKRYKVKLEEFCIGCVKEKENQQHTKEYINMVKEKTGHTVLSADFTTRKVTYQCGNCHSVSESFTHNMLNSNTGVCHNCQNWKFKLSYEQLKSDVESYGMKLITAPDQYTGNKQMLDVMCECGKPYQMILSSIRQDKKCAECKLRKYKETCMERYGVENTFQSEEIKRNIKETCLEKYGETHHMKNKEVFRSALQTSYLSKPYTLPSGKVIMIQGYEARAIDDVLKEGILEEHLVFGNDIPSFTYLDEGTERTYHPDFYIPSKNMIVEVKSTYTLESKKEQNDAKFKKVVEDGYKLRLMVYDNKHKIQDIVYES